MGKRSPQPGHGNDPQPLHLPPAGVVTDQFMRHETRPLSYSYHPAYSQVYTENVWGKAISRVVTEKWSREQAVDEAVNRIQTIFNSWK